MTRESWFSKHTDTVIILGAFAATILWINGKFNNVETRLTRIETVLVMQKIMPQEFCVTNKKNGDEK
jgi:hypothetical protein